MKNKILSKGFRYPEKPLKHQFRFYKSTATETILYGPRGGGKSRAIYVKAIHGALKYKGCKILILCKTNSERKLVFDAIAHIVNEKEIATIERGGILFKNGSFIRIALNDYRCFCGEEFDQLMVDEAQRFSIDDINFAVMCLRNRKAPNRIYLTYLSCFSANDFKVLQINN